MNRNQTFTTLEFIDGQVRLCVGSYYNGEFYIFDTFANYSSGFENGIIVNEEEVGKTLIELIALAKQKTEFLTNEVIFCLPNSSIKIEKNSTTSRVNSKNFLITQQDIDNAIRIAYQTRVDKDEEIVEIIPVEFITDSNQSLDFIPLGYKSTTFRLVYNLITLPKELINSYNRIAKMANIVIVNRFLDILCLYDGIYKEEEKDGAILNISKYNISLNIFKKGRLLQHLIFDKGINEVILKVMEVYNLNYIKAEKLVLINGNARCDLSNNHAIFEIVKDNKKTYVSEKELAQIVEEELGKLLESVLNNTNNYLFREKVETAICGFGCAIKNLDAKFYQLSKVETSIARSQTPGIDLPNNTQTFGLIRLNYEKLSQNNFRKLQNEKESATIEEKDTSTFSIFEDLDFDEEDN